VRYLITGGAGYIGSRLVDFLSRREETEKVVICDVASPQGYVPKTEFERVDVRDRDAVRATLERAQPDALVHLAFVLNPSHDETLMYDVDVNGTHNVLEAAAAAGTRQVLVTSVGRRIRGVPRQSGSAHRGRSGPGRIGLLIRA
jgi:UDP-glucose 4-epimerase